MTKARSLSESASNSASARLIWMPAGPPYALITGSSLISSSMLYGSGINSLEATVERS